MKLDGGDSDNLPFFLGELPHVSSTELLVAVRLFGHMRSDAACSCAQQAFLWATSHKFLPEKIVQGQQKRFTL